MNIKENDIVTFKDNNGDKLKGKVVLVFTSVQGNQCVHINNFATNRLIKDITKAGERDEVVRIHLTEFIGLASDALNVLKEVIPDVK